MDTKYFNIYYNYYFYVAEAIFFISFGIFILYVEFRISVLFYFILWELTCLVVFNYFIQKYLFIANETYEISAHTEYDIHFPKDDKKEGNLFPVLIRSKDKNQIDNFYLIDNKDKLHEWKRNYYKSSVLKLLLCSREYNEECVFFKDYLPLDLFKIFINKL